MIFNLLKNPLIKIIGIGAILYFGLVKNDSPNSLGNRLSSENIKESKETIWQKAQMISHNLQLAQQMKNSSKQNSATSANNQNSENISNNSNLAQNTTTAEISGENSEKNLVSDEAKIITTVVVQGNNKEVFCGDNVEFAIIVFDEMMKQLHSDFQRKMTVKNDKNSLIKDNILQMHENEVRSIEVSKDAALQDVEMQKYFKNSTKKIFVQIVLTKIKSSNSTNKNC